MLRAWMFLAICPACWMWDRVLTDCHGDPETTAHYLFSATTRITAQGTCIDEDGNPYTCASTQPADPRPFAQIPDPGTGFAVETSLDPVEDPDILPLPPVGGLTAWPWPSPENPEPVIAVDLAGNWSTLPCP